MLGFLSRWGSNGSASAKPARLEAITARPVQLVEGKLAPGKSGGARLTVKLDAGRATARFFRMPSGSTKSFELDPLGLFVWNACDGKTSVQQIVRRLAKEYNLNLREAEVSTVQFIRTLMKKGLLGVAMGKSADRSTS